MKYIMRHKTESLYSKIPFLGGRPKRELNIDKDDIINLMIALELTGDVALFLEDRHLFN